MLRVGGHSGDADHPLGLARVLVKMTHDRRLRSVCALRLVRAGAARPAPVLLLLGLRGLEQAQRLAGRAVPALALTGVAEPIPTGVLAALRIDVSGRDTTAVILSCLQSAPCSPFE